MPAAAAVCSLVFAAALSALWLRSYWHTDQLGLVLEEWVSVLSDNGWADAPFVVIALDSDIAAVQSSHGHIRLCFASVFPDPKYSQRMRHGAHEGPARRLALRAGTDLSAISPVDSTGMSVLNQESHGFLGLARTRTQWREPSLKYPSRGYLSASFDRTHRPDMPEPVLKPVDQTTTSTVVSIPDPILILLAAAPSVFWFRRRNRKVDLITTSPGMPANGVPALQATTANGTPSAPQALIS